MKHFIICGDEGRSCHIVGAEDDGAMARRFCDIIRGAPRYYASVYRMPPLVDDIGGAPCLDFAWHVDGEVGFHAGAQVDFGTLDHPHIEKQLDGETERDDELLQHARACAEVGWSDEFHLEFQNGRWHIVSGGSGRMWSMEHFHDGGLGVCRLSLVSEGVDPTSDLNELVEVEITWTPDTERGGAIVDASEQWRTKVRRSVLREADPAQAAGNDADFHSARDSLAETEGAPPVVAAWSHGFEIDFREVPSE